MRLGRRCEEGCVVCGFGWICVVERILVLFGVF